MRTGIFTPFSMSPMHPRTEMYLCYFRERGLEADIVTASAELKRSGLGELLSKLLINMFDFASVHLLKDRLDSYDCVLIQDLKFLPLAIFARIKGKRVIYETLDNSVYVRVYNQRNNRIYLVIRLLTPFFSALEKLICWFFVHNIVVNSIVLRQRFGKKAELVYYASPFETEILLNRAENDPAFLYLGAVTHSKGIDEILELSRKFSIPCYVFGNCSDVELGKKLKQDELIIWKDRISSAELRNELHSIMCKNFLIGISVIKPVNYSYATQEANKEADYMALGIPFIGNKRDTTREKIEAGCGVFIDDHTAVSNLVNNADERRIASEKCKELYFSAYSIKIFNSKISTVFDH